MKKINLFKMILKDAMKVSKKRVEAFYKKSGGVPTLFSYASEYAYELELKLKEVFNDLDFFKMKYEDAVEENKRLQEKNEELELLNSTLKKENEALKALLLDIYKNDMVLKKPCHEKTEKNLKKENEWAHYEELIQKADEEDIEKDIEEDIEEDISPLRREIKKILRKASKKDAYYPGKNFNKRA